MNIARTLACHFGIHALSLLAFTAECRGQDFNGDGTPDFVEAVATAPGVPTAGAVIVRSGVDNTVLLEIEASDPDDAFGWDFEVLPDLNGDGVPEIAVAAPRSHLWTDAIGRVFVYSGATGAQLHALRGRSGDRIGFTLGGSYDVNGDGIPDVFATGMRLDPIGIPVERHFWFSGASGDMLFDQSYPFPGLKPVILEPLAVWGDLNDDDALDAGDLIELDPLVQEGAPPQAGGDLNEDLLTDGDDFDLLVDSVIAGEPVIANEDRILSAAEWGELAAVMATWATLYPEDPVAAAFDPANWTGGNATLDYWQHGRFTVSGQSIVPGTTQTVCNIDPIGAGQRIEGIAPLGCPDCNAHVQIISAPTIIRLGEAFTVDAWWGDDCDERYWIIHFGAMTVGPIYADTLEHRIDFFEGFEDDVIVKAVCVDTEGNCTKIATVTIPFADCALDLSGCPWEVYGGEEVTLTASAVPPGGTFTWTLTDESCYVAYALRGSTFKFGLREIPTCGVTPGVPLYLTAKVRYELNGCVKERVCIFQVRFDTDRDGLYDDEESLLGCPSVFDPDSDHDGLSDSIEVAAGLDPCDEDSDGDGVRDSCEHNNPDIEITMTSDEDHDGLTDRQECMYGTDLSNRDTDDDGITDGAEIYMGWDPLDPNSPPNGNIDSDGDGVVDVMENMIGTNPNNPDTDNDGLLDGIEVDPMHGTSPFLTDSDHDGLLDGEEMGGRSGFGTFAHIADSDEDGLLDGYELQNGLNPLNGIDGAHVDSDGDGLSNGLEQRLGTRANVTDTDEDGVPDGDEYYARSDPNDESDEGRSLPDSEWLDVVVVLGRSSGHNAWTLRIGEHISVVAGFGERVTETVRVRAGHVYDIRLDYGGTEQAYLDEFCMLEFKCFATVTPSTAGQARGFVVDDEHILGSRPYPDCYPFDQSCAYPTEGKVAKLYVPLCDIDVDSDNDNGLDVPDRSKDEEDIEGDAGRAGKVMLVNIGDADQDGIPDYADGYDLSVTSTDDDQGVAELKFVPVVVQAGGYLDAAQCATVRVTFDYDASDPAAVVVSPGSGGVPVSYSPASGALRLWRKNGDQARDKRVVPAGDYIVPGESYSLADLGMGELGGTVTQWAEAVRPSDAKGDLRIAATFTGPNGGEHAVQLTAVGVTVHDLRHWEPGFSASGPTVQHTDPDRAASLAQPNVGGAITDGVSMCLVRATPPLADLPLSFGVRRTPGAALIDQPQILGAIVTVNRSPGLSALPEVPMVAADTHWSCDATSDDGLAIYVPPPNYIDRTLNPVTGALEPGETTTIAFEIGINGSSIGSVPFNLRRPPIVFVHGLFGSGGNYWGRQLADETLPTGAHAPGERGVPLPTRLYFADYASINTQGYDEIYPVVPKTIRAALQDYWNATDDVGTHAHWATPPTFHHVSERGFKGVRYAATRVDVVAHSMGGQATRLYVSDANATVPRVVESFWTPIVPWVPTAFKDFDSRHRHNPVTPPAAEDYRWWYIRPDNFGCGDIRRFVPIASPFRGSPIGDVVTDLFEPTVEKQGVINGISTAQRMRGRPDPFAKAFPSGNRKNAPEAFYDLATMSFTQRLLAGAAPAGTPPTGLFGAGTGVAYPTGRAAVRWYPIAGRIFAAHQVQGSALLGNELMKYLPIGNLADLGPGLSDSVVPIESAMNGAIVAGKSGVFDSHEHSDRPGSPYIGLNASGQVAAEIRLILSGPETHFRTEGLE
ncbi:MAG: hypothetical protein KIT19_11500 [Phycisphaeraceae bacterium]|nr:hypothetical protein [Phycisphaeraceae bacterium]